MIKDKDVNSYLKKRQEIEAPNHHDLLPSQLREERLKQRELEKLKSFEKTENPVDKNLSTGLEKFDVDVTKEN